jgi:prepilin peptidase CpaA
LLKPVSDAIALATVAISGGAGAVIDLKTRRVPNVLTFGTAAVGLGLAATHMTALSIAAALGGLVLGLALMLPAHIVGATGAGDVKLFAGFGTLLGPAGIFAALLYTAIAGGALAVIVSLKRRRLRATIDGAALLVATGGGNVAAIEHAAADNRFAYAPAIAIGALVAALRL